MQTRNNGFSLFLLSILFLLFHTSLSLSPDTAALLAFKSSLAGASGPLSSWTDSSSSCLSSWIGVTCDPSSRRVTKLVLENLSLSGDLRPLGRLSELRVLSLKLNRFSSLPIDLSSWPNLKQLHLSYNEFSGNFPHGIGRLRRLRRVNLAHNNFSGEIPFADLARLPRLLTIRLEDNSFVGTLGPALLSTAVSDFSVSGNRLTGEIPASLSRFPATAFTGNRDLCGKPLPDLCRAHKPEEHPSAVSAPEMHRSRGIKKLLAFIAVDAAAGVGAVIIITWCCCKNRQNRDWARKNRGSSGISVNNSNPEGEMIVFEGCKGFGHVEELLKASAELLGKGSVGTTYKVVVEGVGGGGGGGTVMVVVKRVRTGRWQAGTRRRKEVDGWLKVNGGLRHANLVSLRACYHSMDELLLVYDYIPNGSLYTLLHENRGPGRTPTNWRKRLKIASDSARGLAFLHEQSKAKLFHGHLTTSNILIDHSGTAFVSDSGLAHLFPPPPSTDPNQAPELNAPTNRASSHHIKYTQQCDVYSFGIVLLEILTGKTATGEGETSLANWVRRVYERQGSVKEVFDFEVFLSGKREAVEAEMAAVLQVALLCLAPAPKDRPNMGAVCRMIEDIRTKGGSRGIASHAPNNLSSDS